MELLFIIFGSFVCLLVAVAFMVYFIFKNYKSWRVLPVIICGIAIAVGLVMTFKYITFEYVMNRHLTYERVCTNEPRVVLEFK